MIFGRVEGFVTVTAGGALFLTVVLESGRDLRRIRADAVAALESSIGLVDLAWTADQYTQETIATILAEEGWEAVAAGTLPDSSEDGIYRSASYTVRKA